MNDRTDQQLLHDYAERHSEAAFTAIVQRYVDLVYSAAIRLVCDAHAAKDVTQSVFIALAQNARQLSDRPALAGWLHGTARNLAAKAIRSDARRRAREQEVVIMNELLSTRPEANWEHIAPHLDEALGELSEPDRDAVLLRYFKNHDLRTIGATFGISDDAAQKRVSRAVERLREFFAKRGVSVGASGLVVVISANAVQAAPVGLAVVISTVSALAGTTLLAPATVIAAKTIAMTTLQKLLVATALLAGVATTLVIQHRSQTTLREENQSLRQRIAQLQADNQNPTNPKSPLTLSLPAPRVQASTSPPGVEPDWQSTNLLARLQRGEKAPTLTPEQAETYLKESNRSAASLLAAFRTTGDRKYLEEAAEKYPNDPQVAFTKAFALDGSPTDQRHWLDVFKQSSPDNALPNYLSALNHFKSGQTDQAIQDLTAAYGKQQFQDYSWDFIQNGAEAYRAAGYPEVEARVIPAMALVLPHLAELKQLNFDMIDLANAYRQAGDESSAQAALRMDAALGQRLGGPGNTALITQLVGMVIETIALKQMDPNDSYGSSGQTVKGRLDEVTQRKTELTQFANQLDQIYTSISAPDWISYHDRWQAFGEENAMRWLLGKYGRK